MAKHSLLFVLVFHPLCIFQSPLYDFRNSLLVSFLRMLFEALQTFKSSMNKRIFGYVHLFD